jgi:hypothetical protein
MIRIPSGVAQPVQGHCKRISLFLRRFTSGEGYRWQGWDDIVDIATASCRLQVALPGVKIAILFAKAPAIGDTVLTLSEVTLQKQQPPLERE